MSQTSPSSNFPTDRSPAALLYPDLEQEFASTRKMLASVPDGHMDWTPHAKSTSLGSLAAHLAELPRLAATVLSTDELDWAVTPYTPKKISSTSELVTTFDEQAAAMRAVLSNATWDALAKEWQMRAGDQVFVKDRKDILIRTLGISHMAHHRAQLGVYLRLLNIPVPGVYGPSADEM